MPSTRKLFREESWRKDPWFRALCRAFLACETEANIANLLRDVATLAELSEMSERLEIARELSSGKSYLDVARRTGASTTTVTRVARFLFDGAGGYRRALNVHHHAVASEKRSAV